MTDVKSIVLSVSGNGVSEIMTDNMSSAISVVANMTDDGAKSNNSEIVTDGKLNDLSVSRIANDGRSNVISGSANTIDGKSSFVSAS